MNWWRAHHGIANDPKLHLVAMKADAKRGEVLAVWICLLDYASQNTARGSIEGIDSETVSFQAEIDQEAVTRILKALTDKGMISDYKLVAWDKRQYQDCSTERVKRFRNAVKRMKQGETDETHETVSSVSVSVSDSASVSAFEVKKTSLREVPKPWPEDFDFEAWFAERDGKHPIPGMPQLAKSYAMDAVFHKFMPAEFNASHDAWCEYWKTQESGIPKLAVFIQDSWYRKRPPIRAPTRRNKSIDELVEEMNAEESANL